MPVQNTQPSPSNTHQPANEIRSRRSAATVAQYHSRYKTLEQIALRRLNFYGHQEEYPGEIYANAKDMVDQLEIYAKDSSVDSFRTNKSAVLFRFNEALKEIRSSDIPVLMAEIQRATAIRPPSTAKRARKSTNNFIPEKDFQTIVEALSTYRGRIIYGDGLAAWMKAGLATGLRPNEWESATIEMLEVPGSPELVPHLKCINSKRKTAGPAFIDIEKARQEHPELAIENVFDLDRNLIPSTFHARETTRHIPLAEDEVTVVRAHLDAIREAEDSGITFAKYYDSCRKLLERACRDLFDKAKSYTLYTLRHQYAANGKNIFSKEELAARMGHDSVKTAPSSYASSSRAHKSFKEERKFRNKESAEGNRREMQSLRGTTQST